MDVFPLLFLLRLVLLHSQGPDYFFDVLNRFFFVTKFWFFFFPSQHIMENNVENEKRRKKNFNTLAEQNKPKKGEKIGDKKKL